MRKLYMVIFVCSFVYGAVSPYSRMYEKESKNRYDSNLSVFDITISLYNTPSDKSVYEDIIGYFADAVYEQSNGAHKLGNITIYTNSKNRSKADIIWNAREWPRAYGRCFMLNCGSIIFGDVAPFGIDFNMLINKEDAGYVLGHEWGHYVYGLYDEYRGSTYISHYLPSTPLVEDIPTKDAIMNSTWDVLGSAGYKALNHSTSDNFSINTAQGRVYGKSGWDVLIQDTALDPRNGMLSVYPHRTRYNTLIGYEPTSIDSWYKIELPSVDSRSELVINWDDEVDREFIVVLDKSGSMASLGENNISLLNMAKDSVKSFIDILSVDDYIGLVSFDDTSDLEFNITKDTNKTTLKTIIDSIEDEGATNIEGALMSALGDFNYSNDSYKALILLSDGMSNYASFDKEEVVSAFLDKKIPIISIAYGDYADADALSYYADNTFGSYFKSSLDFAKNQNIFIKALSKISNTNFITNSVSSSTSNKFFIDSSVSGFKVLATYQSASKVNVKLISPSNKETLLDCNDVNGSNIYSCLGSISNNSSSGQWTISSSIATTYSVFTTDSSGFETKIDILNQGQKINGSEAVKLTVVTTNSQPVSGLNIDAKITYADGNKTTLSLNDSGTNGDYLANDGIYSAIFLPSVNGSYTVDVSVNNSNSRAFYTQIGANGIVSNKSVEFTPTTTTLNTNFQRNDTLSFEVIGVSSDESTEWNITNVDINNSKSISSKIDFMGDKDWYEINTTNLSDDVVVRIFDIYGFTPNLEILDKNTFSVLYSKSFDSSKDAYLFLDVNYSDVPNIKIRVNDKSNSAIGTYTISVGPKLDLESKLPDVNFTYSVGERSVVFGSDSYSVGKIIKTYWSFGDDTNSSDTNVTHSYSKCALYDVNLSVWNNYGNSNLITKSVQSCKSPIVTSNFESKEAKLNTAFDTNITVDYHSFSFSMDFGDGSNTTSKNIAHTYTKAGDYNISIKAIGSDGNTTTKILPIKVVDMSAPSVDFNYSVNKQDINFTASITNTDGNISSYKWLFDGVSAGTSSTLALSKKSCGEHNVTLSVINSYLKEANTTKVVQVCNKPTVSISASKTSLRRNQIVTFTSNVSDSDSTSFKYSWNFGDNNTATTNTYTHKYTKSGTYLVTLKVTDSEGMSSSASFSVVVSDSTEYQSLVEMLQKNTWETSSDWQSRIKNFSTVVTREIIMQSYDAEKQLMLISFDLSEFSIGDMNKSVSIPKEEARYVYQKDMNRLADFKLTASVDSSNNISFVISDIRLDGLSYNCEYLTTSIVDNILKEYTKHDYESSENYKIRVSDFNETNYLRYCFNVTFEKYDPESGELKAKVSTSPLNEADINILVNINSLKKGENIEYFKDNLKISSEIRLTYVNDKLSVVLNKDTIKIHPKIYYTNFELLHNVSLSLIKGWNLISIPTNEAVPNTNFANREFTYSYYNSQWYKNLTNLLPAVGIWIKNSKAENLNFIGASYDFNISKYSSGWHLVGAGKDFNTTIAGNIQSIWKYKQNSWIKNPTSISVGEGFWIKVK